jgi:hypothetical protein
MQMKKVIHVNQHNIKYNNKICGGKKKPVLSVKDYKTNTYCNNIKIYDKQGKLLLELKYRPENPLSCGAKVWLELDTKNVDLKIEV